MEYSYRYWFSNEYVNTAVYSLVGFFIPLFIGHPQLLVGIIVNSMLIMGALNVKGYKLFPIILAPSLGVLTRGLIFGPFTIFLVYMIPFIWTGNAILVYAFRRKRHYLPTLFVGAVTKSAFLFGSAFMLFKLGIIPVIFLTAMGWMQLITALGGGVLAYGIQKV